MSWNCCRKWKAVKDIQPKAKDLSVNVKDKLLDIFIEEANFEDGFINN
jgi:hypothetical protein